MCVCVCVCVEREVVTRGRGCGGGGQSEWKKNNTQFFFVSRGDGGPRERWWGDGGVSFACVPFSVFAVERGTEVTGDLEG